MTDLETQSSKILMVFAHADDETLLAGALIAKLVSDGHAVTVLCLAPGDDDRTKRLHKACEVLGVGTVETLRYSEGVMWRDELDEASSESEDLNLTPVLSVVPVGDLASRVGGRVSEINPDIVITHSVHGDYGHPDHAAVYEATLRAVERSASDTLRLYTLSWPRWMVKFNIRLMKLGGREVRKMGPRGRFNLSAAVYRSQKSTTSIKVGNKLGVRREASRWYSVEIARGPLPMRVLERVPLWIQSRFLGKARLTLVNKPKDVPGNHIL
jgi:LmbE family N-acetylglucosaminyl deacetylase